MFEKVLPITAPLPGVDAGEAVQKRKDHMDNTELMKKIEAYGADMSGIDGRFLGDSALYESCFRDLVCDPVFEELERAVSGREYEAAFLAAHALKGVLGNMGLTPCYDAICALVESLRAGDYQAVDAETSAVKGQLLLLRGMLER